MPTAEQVRDLLKEHRDRVPHARGDLVFPGERGEFLDGSALRRRYKKALVEADLRPLRFHDLRHTFGSIAINQATIVQVQAWMGHADVQITMKYIHHRKPRRRRPPAVGRVPTEEQHPAAPQLD